MEAIFFYLFATFSILGALGVIFSPQPTRALLALFVTLLALSGLYVLLGAPFVAMINLVVYAGAVLVLFLFVIMFLGLGASDVPISQRFHPAFIPFAALTVLGFSLALFRLFCSFHLTDFSYLEGTVREIGLKIFTQYLLPFELISVLLLLAIFAAITLAKREDI